MLRAARVRRDEREVDLRLRHRGQLDLRPFRFDAKPLQSRGILTDVYPVLRLELISDEVHKPHVEVVAAEVRVPVRRLHLEHALAQLQDRYVECPATQVVDRDRRVALLLQTVGKRRGGGLIDDSQDLEAGYLPGHLGGLALAVREVRGHRDDRLGHRLAQLRLGVFLQLP